MQKKQLLNDFHWKTGEPSCFANHPDFKTCKSNEPKKPLRDTVSDFTQQVKRKKPKQ